MLRIQLTTGVMRQQYRNTLRISCSLTLRRSLNLADDYPALVLLRLNVPQIFLPSLIKTISMLCLSHRIAQIVYNPSASVNKAVKNQLRTQLQSWYAQQICHQRQEGKEKKPIDLRMGTIKPLSASWIVAGYNCLKINQKSLDLI